MPNTPVELKGSSRLGSFAGMLLFTLIWNGILSVFLHECYQGWAKGDPEYFLAIFLIPFVLVGLGTLGGAVYYFLGIFNPRPHLRINARSAVVGEALTLDWTIAGRTETITDYTITLEGREEATYRRGTSTYTDKETFAKVILFTTNNPQEMRQGQVPVMIPFETMHTFDGGNNKIVWAIKVTGNIQFWPNIGDEFEIEVLPIQPPEDAG